jgi:hypothetical protein
MILDLFSRRKKRLEKEGKQDIYQYDSLPQPFRVQVTHIWKDAIGPFSVDSLGLGMESPSNQIWKFIQESLCREKGLYSLSQLEAHPPNQCIDYLLRSNTDDALDLIELSFRVIDRVVRQWNPWQIEQAKITQNPDDAIQELNERFQQHGIGYRYMGGIIVRADSQVIHSDVVEPALALLNAEGFDGPADEFIRAFDHYRHGRNKEAIAEALKAFESTMKAICKARNWAYPQNATAKPLIDLLFSKGLVPAELQTHFGGLRSALEAGLPTVSNRTSRHGQGPDPTIVPSHVVAYMLHLAASNIVFLVEAHKAGIGR